MKKLLILFIALLGFQLSIAQNSPTEIEMTASNWEIPEEAISATFETFDNRETLLLNGAKITAKKQNFSNGTIEVDVYANSNRSFAGIIFRKQNDNLEEVYMRMHKSNQADAVQYTPVLNNESNWQLYRECQAAVSLKHAGWNNLRVEVNNASAEVFVNDEKVLSIDNLRTDQAFGEVGLFALFTNRFSNFKITHKDAVESTEKTATKPVEPNIIAQWEITEANVYKEGALQFNDFLQEKYRTVKTEASGLLPISKYVKKSSSGNFERNTEHYIIAATTIHADSAESKLLSFDYSDKIIVYLNGKPIFKGNNAFRAKGVQYMGHLGINTNQLYLPLEKGTNQIHCIVIDKANGWGIMAKLE